VAEVVRPDVDAQLLAVGPDSQPAALSLQLVALTAWAGVTEVPVVA
jgi:hypothetical protein